MSNSVPDGWAIHRQGDICEFSNGRAYKLSEWEREGTPVIRLQNLTGSGKEFYYSNLELPKRQYCEYGDLLYMWSATFGPHIWKGPKAIYHYHIWKVAPDEVNLTKDYSYHLLGYKNDEWMNQSNGMGILHVTKGGMEDLPLTLPPLPEQQKIASILSSVDEVIEKTQAQINKLKDLKTGMMQELLTKGVCDENGNPHTKFKDSPAGRIPVGWEVSTLGEVASLQRGHDLIRANMVNGPYPVISSSGFNGMNHEYTTEGPGIAVGRKGSIGRVHYIESNYWAHDTSLYVTNFFGNNVRFIFYLFIWMDLQQYGTKSGSPSLNRNDIHPLKVAIPPVTEQEKIQGMLSNVDNRLRLLSDKREKLVQTKKALMQDLLTGKVRVTVPLHPCNHGISASLHVKAD